ncbi:LptA/OstA family protein [Granulicella cerasi]|uniref:LptA/OstA family protein n=1 Tax=Granulicella cerasi TaxID=741063 RepID=A0ABW1Z7C2_9BACT
MRLSVERLRWVLSAGAILLVLVVFAFVGYGRYKALKTFRDLIKHSGATITHSTHGFTYSQTSKGRTLFTIHAARAEKRDDSKWALHDADLTLFDKNGKPADHIYGAEFEYDPDAGLAKALGEVHMDLQAPESLSKEAGAQPQIGGKEGRAPSALRSAADATRTIHVKTSGLVYMKALSVAATQEDVEFSYRGLIAHSHGAEFDQDQSIVHLLADVRLDGDLHGKPISLRAAKADLDRTKNIATLQQPTVESDGKRMRSANALINLRKDGSVESGVATGDVQLAEGTRIVRGQRLDVTMNENAMPKLAIMTGNVTLDDTSADRPMHGGSNVAQVHFDAKGEAHDVVAQGAAHFTSSDKGLARAVAGDLITVSLLPKTKGRAAHADTLHVVGHAIADGDSFTAKTNLKRHTNLRADDLLLKFRSGQKSVPEQLLGNGHAMLDQLTSNGERQQSTADRVQMSFDNAGQLAQALEVGNVHLRSETANRKDHTTQVSTGSAENALYDAASATLKLTTHAQVQQGEMQMAAREITLDNTTQDAQASGEILATLLPGKPMDKSESSHIMADAAQFSRGGQYAIFTGSDARPARLWQGGSQILAAKLTLDGRGHTLMARPNAPSAQVTAIFTSGAVLTQSLRRRASLRPRRSPRASTAPLWTTPMPVVKRSSPAV